MLARTLAAGRADRHARGSELGGGAHDDRFAGREREARKVRREQGGRTERAGATLIVALPEQEGEDECSR
jgi:hypothetical protein